MTRARIKSVKTTPEPFIPPGMPKMRYAGTSSVPIAEVAKRANVKLQSDTDGLGPLELAVANLDGHWVMFQHHDGSPEQGTDIYTGDPPGTDDSLIRAMSDLRLTGTMTHAV